MGCIECGGDDDQFCESCKAEYDKLHIKEEPERSELELLVDKITDTLAVKLWDTIFGILDDKFISVEDHQSAIDYILQSDDKELNSLHNLITAEIRDRKEEDEREEKDGRS